MNPDLPHQSSPYGAASPDPFHGPVHHPHTLPPSIPDHELIRCIGRGSYGEVWLACNVFGKRRAVKIVRRSTFEEARPVEREFDGIRRFEPISRSHSSQLHVLHAGRGEDYFYYVMELADIGLVTDGDASHSFVGTEGYLPPEGPDKPQADLYSLGKVLYEMSTGCDRKDYPLLPKDWDAIAPSEQARLLELNEVLVRVCEADRQRRYQAAERLRADLELLQRGQSIRQQRVVARRCLFAKKMLTLVGSILLLAVGWRVGVLGFQRSSDPTQQKESVADREEAERLYRKAISVPGDHTKGQFLEKLELLNQAIARNPYFAPAYAALAAAYWAGNEWYLGRRVTDAVALVAGQPNSHHL